MKAIRTLRRTLSLSYDLLYGIGLGTFGFMLDGVGPRVHGTIRAPEEARNPAVGVFTGEERAQAPGAALGLGGRLRLAGVAAPHWRLPG